MFEFKMAWRETRGAWRHFVYFFICIAIGVGALVAVSLFASHVNRAVTREARGLLGGDIEIRSSHPLSVGGERVLATLNERGIATAHISELVAMAARHGSGAPISERRRLTQIVELKAVDSDYPLYGTLVLDPPHSLERLLHPEGETCGTAPCLGAVVQESLLIRMGLSLGDRLKIGQAIFLVTGIVRMEPDRMANAFSLGPRVIVSREGLQAAELIKPGSRVRERRLLKLPEGTLIEPIQNEVKERLAADSVRVSGYREAQPQLKRFLDQLARYLGLIGLTALFIGGLGVAMSVHAFVREKMRTIAILKTVGADTGTVVRVYLVQAVCLGVLGTLAGLSGGVLLQAALPSLLTDVFTTDVLKQLGVSPGLSAVSFLPLVKGALLGLLTTVLFTVWPLLAIRDIKPAAIFRRDIETMSAAERGRWWTRWGLNDRLKVLTGLAVLIGLGGLSVWQAGAWKVGLLFIGGLTLAVVVLFLCGTFLIGGLVRLPKMSSLSLRYAVGNLVRPGGQTVGMLIAIGIAVTIIATVSLVEKALLRQVGDTRPVDAPTFFFIDIQPDQTTDFVGVVERRTGGVKPELTPLVRSRLHTINGETVKVDEDHNADDKQEESKEDRRKQWYLSREYVLTYLDRLPKGNEIVQGHWWISGDTGTTPLVSVEEEAAKAMGLNIGSVVEFDIQGATVAAQVASIRKVDWGSFSTNFYMILSPGSLDGAPLTYVGTIHVPPAQEIPLQEAVVAAFPNVSAIHVGDVLDNFGRVLDRLSLAIRAVALFCLLAGGFVMAAALAATRYRRLYESVILKALGATRTLIGRIFALEYALLGFIGGTIAVGLSSALSWLVLVYIFELPWSFQPVVLCSALALTMGVTVTVGFLGTFRLLGEKPLAILRHE
ncbi:MAG TPA: FtsX-like permease family protein [Nitrospira sp.]|nr:FtsX-like permease family protein [Nitrospira sp.]